jgi:hypothetical protein
MNYVKKLNCIILIFILAPVIGQAKLDNAYSEGLKLGESYKNKAATSIQNFNPTEAFKDKKGKILFTETPPEADHYQAVEQGSKDVLENEGRNSIDKNDATKTIWKSFGNPKIKLNADDSLFDSSREIIKNSAAIATGVSSSPGEIVKDGDVPGINCQESKVCRIEYVKKTCNEEVKPLKKICTRTPIITVNEAIYPNCKQLVITKHYNNYCPSGYGQLFYADLVLTTDNHWDDIRFCTREVFIGEDSECFSGGYIITSNRNNTDLGSATVPKKLHARIKISSADFNDLFGTIINETTGQTLYSKTHFSNGQIIELPYSETQDQTFRFYADSSPGRGRSTGVMVLYIDHINHKTVDVTWPETLSEMSCHDE